MPAPSDPGPAPPPQFQLPPQQLQLGVASAIHAIVDSLFTATSRLELIPREAWLTYFGAEGEDLADTAEAAAVLARDAYNRALSVEVLTARAMGG